MHLVNMNILLLVLLLIIRPIKCYETRDDFDMPSSLEPNYNIPIGKFFLGNIQNRYINYFDCNNFRFNYRFKF